MRDDAYQIDRDIWPDELPRTFKFIDGERPLHEYIKSHAQNRPNDPAVTFYGNTLSWEEINEKVGAFARQLHAYGYKKGDVCALHLQNCPQFFIAYHGAHRAGLVVTPLNPQYKASALKHQLQDNGAGVIITHPDIIAPLREVQHETEINDIITVQYDNYAGDANIPVHDTVAKEGSHPDDTIRFLDFVRNSNDDVELPDVEVNDLALLQYTGGTTGLPKGCKHTHWNILFKATNSHIVYQYQTGETHLVVMPIFHVGGKTIHVDACTVTGNQIVFLPRYTPKAVMAAIDEYDITFSYFTVPMTNEMSTHTDVDDYDLTSLSDFRDVTYVSSLGTNLTRKISNEWREITGTRLQETAYGLSETHTMDTHTVGKDRIEPEKGVFTGQLTYGGEIEIRDFETNEPLKPGEEGEIVIRTPSLMKGYLERPEATEEVLEDDGFLHTGDIGRMTDEGYLYFLGRQKDVIKVSGHTVAPREIENILENDERIQDAVAVGKPHETRGSVVEAYIIPNNESLTEEDVISIGKQNLAEYKTPKSVVFVEGLPRTDVGKVDRVAFRQTLPEGYE
jgi:long-chain acyl-CoA synthetase